MSTAVHSAQTSIVARHDPIAAYAFAFAFVSSAALVFSIFVAHTCLAIAFVLLLFSKTPVRVPPAAWPVAGFMVLTLASAAASDNPAAAWPQIKKFYVFAALPLVFSLFPRWDQTRKLIEAWFVCALGATLLSIGQFIQKAAAARAAGESFYEAYVGERITGFFSHWMTFSEVGMLVFLVLVSYLLFSNSARRYGWGVWFGCGLVIGFALVLSYTRGVWLALLVAGGYLAWHWNRRLLLGVPLVLLALVTLSPGAVQRRLASMANPDANSNRLIMWQTGASMIKAHPWLGVGPERVGPRFAEFMPSRFASMDELPPAYYNHLHNVYIHYAAERGIPAMLMLLWLLAKVMLDHQRALSRLGRGPGDEKFLLRAVIAATLGVAVVGCFDLTLGDSEILGFYLTLIALGYGAVERVHRAVDAGVPIA